MKFLSVCSGVGGLDEPLFKRGFECVGFFEIDSHASAVLKYHHKEVLNYGDLTKQEEHTIPYFDILVGGTSCQSFSISGKREGMEGVSGLFLHFAKVLNRYKPQYFIWENVLGSLNSSDGWDFTRVLHELSSPGYDIKWQVLKASDHGIPQDRERVFVYGSLGGIGMSDLFFESKKREPQIVDRKVLPKKDKITLEEYAQTLGGLGPHLALSKSDRRETREYRAKKGSFNTLSTGVGGGHKSSLNVVFENEEPRKLTILECERVMGWSDGFTKYGEYPDGSIKEISDNQRYRMCGNGVVPDCVAYILNSMLGEDNKKIDEEPITANYLF